MHLVIIIIASHMILKKVTSHRNFTRILYWFASVITDVAVHAWGAPLSARAFVHLVYKGLLVPCDIQKSLCSTGVFGAPLGVEGSLWHWCTRRVFGASRCREVFVHLVNKGLWCTSAWRCLGPRSVSGLRLLKLTFAVLALELPTIQ